MAGRPRPRKAEAATSKNRPDRDYCLRGSDAVVTIVGMPGGPSQLILTDDNLPSMFRSADSASLAGQADTVQWSALQLAMLVTGAVLCGVDIKLSNGLDLGALVAAIALLASLVPALWLTANNPQRAWYRGRAAAESLRTLSWKYAVRAEPFAGTDSAADERLLQDMASILRDLRDVGWPTGAGGSAEITEQMRRNDGPHGTALVPEFAHIPAGTHRIGAENTPYALERPVHEVTLPAFGLARRPVTNAEYAHFIAAGGYDDDRWWRTAQARRWRRGEGIHDLIADEWRKKRDNLRRRPALPVDMLRTGVATLQQAVSMVKLTTMTDGALRSALTDIYGTEPPRAPAYWYDSLLGHPSAPVVGVSIYEAEAYCAWLSAATGEPIRLPTEHEWEAAASVDGRVLPYGDTFIPLASNTFELHARGTLPVGIFPEGRSPHGVDDLCGNVFEWTASAPEPYPYAWGTATSSPDAPSDARICRGGSWRHHQNRARAAYRGRGQCFVRNDDLGFRISRG